jgi:hypothetical protein
MVWVAGERRRGGFFGELRLQSRFYSVKSEKLRHSVIREGQFPLSNPFISTRKYCVVEIIGW